MGCCGAELLGIFWGVRWAKCLWWPVMAALMVLVQTGCRTVAPQQALTADELARAGMAPFKPDKAKA